ncbi:class I SAM-dependent methyltransferase [Iodidimonas sp. SYSU 1G8]|uniref:class I SAM-dependent methyltransferase n=1 Tax=Iodidimonas sp. SYSU 1G8 TaxID=3133967 RepID=UPI0031FE80F7
MSLSMGASGVKPAPVLSLGYAEPAKYLLSYEQRNSRDRQRRLSVQPPLDLWRAELEAGWLAQQLGPSPRCLIQGCASTNNVDTLIQFLAEQGIPSPEIHVIDLIDLRALGQHDPRAHYHQADAADLNPIFAAGTIDFLLNDHLMNCAPVTQYAPIMGEITRVLRVGGLAMVNYTDPSEFPTPSGEPLRQWLGADLAYYRLGTAEIVRQAALESLSDADRLIRTPEGFIAVTLPFGNLEHFIPFQDFAARLQAAGLEFRDLRITSGLDHNASDANGLACRRHHCILSPCPR